MPTGTRTQTRQDYSLLPCSCCMELTRQRARTIDADGDAVTSEKPLCEECSQ